MERSGSRPPSDESALDGVAVAFRNERYADSYTSQVTMNGVIRLEGRALAIEFRESTTNLVTLATTVGDVREMRIPLDDVESLTLSRNWPWGSRLAIRTRSLSVLRGLPHAEGNVCAFRIKRREYDRARELSEAVSLQLGSEQMRRLGEGG
jgi:hypothetical protein